MTTPHPGPARRAPRDHRRHGPDDAGRGRRSRYFVLRWDAPAYEAVPIRAARCAQAAAFHVLGRRIKAAIPHPLREDDRTPPEADLPDVVTAIDHDDAGYVVARADWPAGETRTAREVRRMFNVVEVFSFEESWAYLVRTWPVVMDRSQDRRPRTPGGSSDEASTR